MGSSEVTATKVGILSIGDMGVGIAKLLIAHGFPVATNCEGRSEDTVERARNAKVELVSSDGELVRQCQVILSVVPPRDAEATAKRIINALSGSDRRDPLYFADLNAVAPSTSKHIASLFEEAKVPVRLIDGCILGGPPRRKESNDPGTNISVGDATDAEWLRPHLPISGPHSIADLHDGERLASILNFRSISSEIGAASGLKMCFAAMSKGITAIATQSFTTAARLGVVDELKLEMSQLMPVHFGLAQKGVPQMVPKAYRWVREMEEISLTMSEEGGWGKEMFLGAAGIYDAVAKDEVLGQEKIGKRKKGTSVEEVATLMGEGLARKKKKTE